MLPRYSYAGVPTLQAFASSDAFIRAALGPFGSGKSSACVWEIARRGLAQAPAPDGVRRSRWAVIRNTYGQLADTTIKTFLQWFPPHVFGDWRPSDHRYIIRSLRAADNEPGAEIEVLFRALDRPDQVGNLLSLELTGAWINEAREVPWTIIDAVQGRVGRFPARRDGGATWSGIIMDTNPPDVDSEFFKFFEETDHSDAVKALAQVMPGMTVDRFCKLFKQPSGLSPQAENLSNLPAGYYERLAVGKTREWVKVYIHGEYGFVIDGRAVFEEEYDDDFHCREIEGRPDLPVYRGWDFGLCPSCIFTQLFPNGQWRVLDEMVSSSMGIDKFSDDVLQFSSRAYPRMEFVDLGDPAGMQRAQTDERTCFEILHAKGIEIQPGLQTLAIRLESLRKPLRTLVTKGQPQFVMDPRCRMLRRGFMGGYQFRRMRVSGEQYSDAPAKNQYSHPMDALGYVATHLFAPHLRTYRGAADPIEDEDAPIHDMSRSRVTGY